MSWPLASFLILALALGAGFAWYERSRPSSRTVAVVATLAALATLGRLAFAPLPSVKPTTDIVLIAGFVLGGAPGFAVGAVTAIASNVVFGQGPWTPWQMLAWGMVGLLGAGLGRARRGRRIPRLVMALICAAAGFAYGLVLNLYTFVTFTGQHTLAQFLVIEGAAFGFDLAHAIGNFLFFLLFGSALIRALQRFQLRLEVQWGSAATAAALLGLVLAALGGGGFARPPRAQAAPTPAARALAYLRRVQNTDGGFGLAPGAPSSQLASAWVVIGVAAAGEPAARLARSGRTAVGWISGHLGQLQGPGDLERTILALAAARAPLGTLVTRLREAERSDGSTAGQVNLTAFAILALRAAGSHALTAPAAWLVRQQNADGGFGIDERGDPSDVDITAAAIEALRAAGRSPAALARALAFLEHSENADGGFPEQPAGASNSQSTAWAVQALAALHAPTARALTYLRARLGPTGAVSYAAGITLTPVWVTAEALAAFAQAPLPIG